LVSTQSNDRTRNFIKNKTWEENLIARDEILAWLEQGLGETFQTATLEADFRGIDILGSNGTRASVRLRRPSITGKHHYNDFTLRPAEISRLTECSYDIFIYGFVDRQGHLLKLYLVDMPAFAAGFHAGLWEASTKQLTEIDRKSGGVHQFTAFPFQQLEDAGVAYQLDRGTFIAK
jgi:hypothetical protein